jgi:hypothetical protein
MSILGKLLKTMSNDKQSSVEWLISQLQKSKDWNRVLNEVSQMSTAKIDIIEQAKAMHKDEIIEAWIATDNELQRIVAEQYYNQTYGGTNEQ